MLISMFKNWRTAQFGQLDTTYIEQSKFFNSWEFSKILQTLLPKKLELWWEFVADQLIQTVVVHKQV